MTPCTWASTATTSVAIFGDYDVGSVYDVFRTALHTRWKAEDEGELSDILNICVAHEGSSIKLSQPTYIDTMVDRYLPDDKLRVDKVQKTPYSLHFKDNITEALAAPPAAHSPPDLLAGGFPLCCLPPLVWCFPLWLCGGGPPLRFFCRRLQLAFMTSYTAPSGGSASDDWTKPGRTRSKARSITRADDPADSALRHGSVDTKDLVPELEAQAAAPPTATSSRSSSSAT